MAASTAYLFNFINLDFSDPTDPDRIVEEVAAFAAANPDKEWIRGGSWGVGVFPNNSPSKDLLDDIVPDRPVVLIDQTGHACWLNSRGLELAGIDAATPTDELVIIDKDPATGEPTGVVRESALRIVEQAAAQPTAEEFRSGFSDVFAEFNAGGVTTMQTAEGNTNYLDVVQAMEAAGELTVRLFVSWDWHTHQTTPFTDDEMDAQIADRARYASDLIDPNFVKIFGDGVPDGYAVPLLEPYSDGSGEYGKGKLSSVEFKDVVVAFDAQGVGTFIHSIGDATCRAILDAIDEARKVNGDTGVRHKIAHLTLVHPDDMARFATTPGLAGEISPAATYPSAAMDSYVPLFGEDRTNRIYPAGSLLRAGARIGYGSDWLTLIPPSPWKPMQGLVTRMDSDQPELGVLNEDERVSVPDAIRMFTINGAYAVGAEDRLGSIEAGKHADMIVLNHNLLDIPDTEIASTVVEQTVLAGETVYEA